MSTVDIAEGRRLLAAVLARVRETHKPEPGPFMRLSPAERAHVEGWNLAVSSIERWLLAQDAEVLLAGTPDLLEAALRNVTSVHRHDLCPPTRHVEWVDRDALRAEYAALSGSESVDEGDGGSFNEGGAFRLREAPDVD